MPIEVKYELKRPMFIMDRRGREAARIHIKRNLPGMVEPGRESQPDFAHDLRPEMKGCTGLFPLPVGQFGPRIMLAGDHGFTPAHIRAPAHVPESSSSQPAGCSIFR